MKKLLNQPKSDTDIEEFLNNYWLGLGDTRTIKTGDPFSTVKAEDDPTKAVMMEMLNPSNFYFTCKHLFNIMLSPMQLVILEELWKRPFPMMIGSRGLSKTTMLAVYAMLKAVLDQGSKIIVCGAGFRQSKLVFDYAQRMWNSSDLLRDLMYGYNSNQGPKMSTDRYTITLGDSEIIAIPVGDGQKIRGLRANTLLTDEFHSINPEIFEVVLSGFTAVSSSPMEAMRHKGKMKALKSVGVNVKAEDEESNINQSIISGTCYYTFNHFYSYWKKWKSIVESKGDINKIEEIFGGDIPKGFNWRDYSVIRIPVELIPEGFMDDKTISKAKMSLHSSQYLIEYCAIFPNDSMGFFKRTLIESCVSKENHPIEVNGKEISFNVKLKGNNNLEYVFGIDPASEKDNFSIVVLELNGDHRRIVYCWTTRRKEFKQEAIAKNLKIGDFYQYCARKIRDLMKDFPCRRIVMDAQGGGRAISESLQNKDSMEIGEFPIYEIIDENKEKPTDLADGLHILELVEFSRAQWVADANHGMKKDFEDKTLLFPDYDAALLAIAQEEGEAKGQNAVENCILEIEELKDELSTIVHSQTGIQSRERWDTPEIKMEGNKKGHMRKDRYSALLMGNMAARILDNKPLDNKMGQFYGNVVQTMKKVEPTGKMYVSAPDWFGTQGDQHAIVIRR